MVKSLMVLLRTLFSFSGTLSRRAYVLFALCGVVVKHLLDWQVATAFGRSWSVLSYLVPLGVPIQFSRLSGADEIFLATMLAVSVPFAWVGLAITVKRFRSIGWPPWLVLLFFVPIANIASFAVAALWPDARASADQVQPPRWLERLLPKDAFGSALIALLVTAVIGLALVPLGTQVLNTYGWGLFVAIPFVQGAVAAFVYGVSGPRSLWASISVAMLAVAITALGLLALALEGALCIAMATPIALAFAALGALFGHVIQRGTVGRGASAAAILMCIAIAPAIMGAESIVPRTAPIYMVRTSIDIDAAPAVVWRNVIGFRELPPPTELPFRIGIAYPERAHIVGSGVGAIRYCEFSTGAFVEPITVWQPDRKLAFNVSKNPEPMREWSPYGHIDTPHLHGYMTSLRGQFELKALPGGRTRLIGTTWYQHHLWPASYWALWSDAIVHDIHWRVLKHIKTLSEGVASPRA
jgi:uncharacterized membrane protein YhaH (DUF805 family)